MVQGQNLILIGKRRLPFTMSLLGTTFFRSKGLSCVIHAFSGDGWRRPVFLPAMQVSDLDNELNPLVSSSL